MNDMIPRLRMFAGPNGSGKSTVIKEVLHPKLLGIYLNADDIEKQIMQNPIFELADYPFDIHASALIAHFTQSDFLASAGLTAVIPLIKITHHTALDFSQIQFNSYFASVLVEFLRLQCLKHQVSFTFETVMSSKDKVRFLAQAQALGYRTYLYFVATADPEINISRVNYRVQTGGHPVPEDKIRSRYYKTLHHLIDAINYSNRAYIFDNSAVFDRLAVLDKTGLVEQHSFIAEITEGKELEIKSAQVPGWFKTYVLDRFI